MGSFTSLASKEVLNAIFPTAAADLGAAGTNLTSLSAAANVSVLKIYTNATGASFGIFSGGGTGNGSVVRHRVDLIKNSNSSITALPDTHFVSNGISTAGSGAGYTFATYTSYQGMCTVNSTVNTGNHQWYGWTINGTAEGAGTWKVITNGQIGFPQSSSTNSEIIHGFVISAAQTPANAVVSTTTGLAGATNNATTILTSAPTPPVIIAYGDLASPRTVAQNDTPVFTSGAIVITLD